MSAYIQTVVGSDSPPVGAVMDFAGNVEPSGWLFCFGQSLPRAGIYAQLFSVIGTLYGSVDGSSFSLPDFRGRVGAGKDDMGGSAANRLVSRVNGNLLGASGGAESHALISGELASHTHSYLRQSGVSGGYNFTSGSTLATQLSADTGTVTGGSGVSHNNVQPTFIVNKIIKYTVSGTVLPIVPGTGDVVGPDGGVIDGYPAVFNGTSGKFIKSAGFRPSVVLASNGNVIVSGFNAEAFHWTYLLPANMLKDGDSLRISFQGMQLDATAVTRGFRIKFNGVSEIALASAPTSQITRSYVIQLWRVSQTSQRYTQMQTMDATPFGTSSTAAIAVDLGIDQEISLSAYQAAAGSRAQLHASTLEFLPL